MQSLLPQNDPDRDTRTQAIEEQRQNYEWSYYPKANGTPMVKTLPEAEQPFNKPEWIRDVFSVILRVVGNQSLGAFLDGGIGITLVRYGLSIWIYRFINNLSNTIGSNLLNHKPLTIASLISPVIFSPSQLIARSYLNILACIN